MTTADATTASSVERAAGLGLGYTATATAMATTTVVHGGGGAQRRGELAAVRRERAAWRRAEVGPAEHAAQQSSSGRSRLSSSPLANDSAIVV